jgi:heme oxygenase
MLTSSSRTVGLLRRAAAGHGRRHLAAAVTEKTPKLCDVLESATLTYMSEPGRQREFALGVIRPLASRAEEVAQLRSLSAVYGALEDALDDEATKSWSVVGRLWAGQADSLRRSARLKADLEATGSMRFSDAADEHSLSVATRQYVRRVKAAKEIDANLLIGHLFARHVLFDLGRLQPWKVKPTDLARWTQGVHGYTPQRYGFDGVPPQREYTEEEQDHYG